MPSTTTDPLDSMATESNEASEKAHDKILFDMIELLSSYALDVGTFSTRLEVLLETCAGLLTASLASNVQNNMRYQYLVERVKVLRESVTKIEGSLDAYRGACERACASMDGKA
jgi:hypothetical protein